MISHETKRAKRIRVELVRQAGGQVHSRSQLFRAFWRAHLSYAANSPGYLSTWPIIRTPHGPAIGDFDLLLSEMLHDGWLTIDEVQIGATWAIAFSLGPSCPRSMFSADALEAIRAGVQSCDQPHENSRIWRETPDGEEMGIYADLLADADRERLERDFADLSAALGSTYATSRK
jgi:hypothetical protein